MFLRLLQQTSVNLLLLRSYITRVRQRKRTNMEFQVRWEDGDITWEPWDNVRKLRLLDDYIVNHPEARLNSLIVK